MLKNKIYFGEFKSKEDLEREFNITVDNENILIAVYDCPPYQGYAFVLFEKDGQLYEVNASHCSCYDLSGQWEPEETNYEYLSCRLEDISEDGFEEHDKDFLAALNELIENNKPTLH